jgi:hydroxymethylbilane synthase
MIMARAGLARLGLEERIACSLGSAQMLSAVSQGALGLEIRRGDAVTAQWIAPVENPATRAAIRPNAPFSTRSKAGARCPWRRWGRSLRGGWNWTAWWCRWTGNGTCAGRTRGPVEKAEQIGADLAEVILADGADEVLREIREATDK